VIGYGRVCDLTLNSMVKGHYSVWCQQVLDLGGGSASDSGSSDAGGVGVLDCRRGQAALAADRRCGAVFRRPRLLASAAPSKLTAAVVPVPRARLYSQGVPSLVGNTVWLRQW